jgi:hypothetical protein
MPRFYHSTTVVQGGNIQENAQTFWDYRKSLRRMTMQSNQFDALKAAMDPESLTEACRAKKDDTEENLQENAQEPKEKTTVSLDEAQDVKIAEARNVPTSARISQIAEACGGTRDPSLTEQ